MATSSVLLSDQAVQSFKRIVETSKNRMSIILSHVDPDSIGSALAMQEILSSFGRNANIYYCGYFGHPQNRAIANKFNLKNIFLPIEKLEDYENDFVLLDSSAINDERLCQAKDKLNPIIIIDHHRGMRTKIDDQNFHWIEDMGACCTLLIELMEKLEIKIEKKTALVLALGIFTDTKSLVSCKDEDLLAYLSMKAHFQPEEFNDSVNYALPESHYHNINVATGGFRREGASLVASCGYMDASNGDDLASLADFFIRMEGVTFVLVWGIIGGVLRICARNENMTVPLDEYLKKNFSERAGAKLTPDGRGEGGVKFELSNIGFWLDEGTQEEFLKLAKKKIENVVFAKQENGNGK